MGKEIKGWVIVTKQGDILVFTARTRERECIDAFANTDSWQRYLSLGYRCVPCTIKINE